MYNSSIVSLAISHLHSQTHRNNHENSIQQLENRFIKAKKDSYNHQYTSEKTKKPDIASHKMPCHRVTVFCTKARCVVPSYILGVNYLPR